MSEQTPGCTHEEVTAYTGDTQRCLDCGARVSPPADQGGENRG